MLPIASARRQGWMRWSCQGGGRWRSESSPAEKASNKKRGIHVVSTTSREAHRAGVRRPQAAADQTAAPRPEGTALRGPSAVDQATTDLSSTVARRTTYGFTTFTRHEFMFTRGIFMCFEAPYDLCTHYTLSRINYHFRARPDGRRSRPANQLLTLSISVSGSGRHAGGGGGRPRCDY